MNGRYDFSQDSEKVRWLKTAFKPHGRAMLERWRDADTKQIGFEAANKKMLMLIEQANKEV